MSRIRWQPSSEIQTTWKLLDNSTVRLRNEIAGAVHEALGPEFEVRSLTIGRGSIEIVILIGTTYYAVSRYKNFIESIGLMVRQIKDLVKRFFERAAPMHVTVSTSWTPGSGLAGLVAPDAAPALRGSAAASGRPDRRPCLASIHRAY